MKRLNLKLKKIKNKIYFLIKIHLTDPKSRKYDIPLQIDEIYLSIQKYMKDVNYDEDKENVIFKEILDFEEKTILNSVIDENWSFIEVLKKGEDEKVEIEKNLKKLKNDKIEKTDKSDKTDMTDKNDKTEKNDKIDKNDKKD